MWQLVLPSPGSRPGFRPRWAVGYLYPIDGQVPTYPGSVTDDARTLVAAFADRLERRDWVGFAELLAEDVVYELPQTRERIRGRDHYVTFNVGYPGDWHIEPQVVLGDAHDGSLLFRWILDGETALAIAFFEVADGHITKITDFWPEPYDPPPGREHLTERF